MRPKFLTEYRLHFALISWPIAAISTYLFFFTDQGIGLFRYVSCLVVTLILFLPDYVLWLYCKLRGQA